MRGYTETEKMGVIYKVYFTNKNNYLFGSSVDFNKRKTNYLSKLRKNKYENCYLQNAFNKYGENFLKFEIVQKDIPENILEYVEDIWIGANCGRIEDKNKGMNMRDAVGSRPTQETKDKIGKANKGRPKTKEELLKLSISGRRKKSGFYEKPLKRKPVVRFNLKGEKIDEFLSLTQAAKMTGIKINMISANLTNKKRNKTAGGFIWDYKII